MEKGDVMGREPKGEPGAGYGSGQAFDDGEGQKKVTQCTLVDHDGLSFPQERLLLPSEPKGLGHPGQKLVTGPCNPFQSRDLTGADRL